MGEQETAALPGTETTENIIDELTEAARRLRDIRRDRMDLTKEEVEAADEVEALMKEHGLTEYRDANIDPPIEVKIVPGKVKVKVKLQKEDEDGLGDE